MFSQPVAPLDLESQLAGVLEQDGITMASPEGLRRRVKRTRKRAFLRSTSISSSDIAFPVKTQDPVADLDAVALGLLITSHEGGRVRPVAVHHGEHVRSPFVVSLRHASTRAIAPANERVSLHAFAGTEERMSEVFPDVFGTLTRDLQIDAIDPRMFTEQFVPEQDLSFFSTGSVFRRVVEGVRGIAGDAWELLHRVQRVEQRISSEVHDAFEVIEIRRLSPVRALAGFFVLLCLATLPANAVALYRTSTDTKHAVERVGQAAIADILSVPQSGSFASSLGALQRASSHFREADTMLTESRALALGLASFMPDTYRSARALLEVGEKASEAGQILGLGFEKVFQDPSRRPDERLDVLATYARGALPLLSDASTAAASISLSSVPADKRESVEKLSAMLHDATQSVQEFAGMADSVAGLIGRDRARTYLVVFQNHTELRPTGGFMGSVAEITLDRGEVKKLFVPPGGTYDLKGQLLEHVISPEPLHLINPHWQFQDANWFPDFPLSAKKIRWFWSKSGQPTVDGVIAINASFVEKLLDVTGPIVMPEYGKTITRENFLRETQMAVEVEYDRVANTPKKFVGDLARELMSRMKTFTPDEWMRTAALVSEALQTKDVQIAMSGEEEESLVERYGWSGRLKETSGDSLALIEANIAGQKTDGVIDEHVDVAVEIAADGSVVDTVTLTRTHRGQKGEPFRGVRNVSYLRAYVPQGSVLLAASGFQTPSSTLFKTPDEDYVVDSDVRDVVSVPQRPFADIEVFDEGSRTVFGGWVQLDPGMTQTVTYRYRLPFTVDEMYARLDAAPGSEPGHRAAYSLLLTSQSGKPGRDMSVRIVTPNGWSVPWSRGVEAGDGGGRHFSGMWDQDRFIAMLLAPSSGSSSP